MADPKKEPVRSAFPPKPETTPGLWNEGVKHDTARIPLPARTPAIPPRRSPPEITPQFPINTSLSIPPPEHPPVLPLLKEHPAATFLQPAPTVVGPNAIDAFDSIPRWFCWGLLGISSLIFFIQIWNYTLS